MGLATAPAIRGSSINMTQSLAELQQLCNVLYNSHNPNERQHAEGILRPFSTNVDYIPQCKVSAPVCRTTARAPPCPSKPLTHRHSERENSPSPITLTTPFRPHLHVPDEILPRRHHPSASSSPSHTPCSR